MTNAKQIADYCLEKYRQSVGFANKALAIGLLILLVNWIFAIEPGYSFIKENRQKYSRQLKETENKLSAYRERYETYYNKNAKDSLTNVRNRFLLDTLQKQYANYKIHPIKRISFYDLGDSLSTIKDITERYTNDSADRIAYRLKITAYTDSIVHLKKYRSELNSVKKQSLDSNLKDYDWKSLIRFVFIVAGDPKEGCVYLMGLITLILIVGFIYRWLCLHNISKALRLYNSESPLSENKYRDLNIPGPFWLAPLPADVVSTSKNGGNITQKDISEILGMRYLQKKFSISVFCILFLLMLLQIRLFYIGVITNPAERFDFIFTVGTIMTLLSFAQCFIWLLPLKIDPHLNTEPSANKISRKIFVSSVLMAGISVLALSSHNSISNSLGRNAKRFRRRKKDKKGISKSSIREGLYYRKKRKPKPDEDVTVYYFNSKTSVAILKHVSSLKDFEGFRKKLTPLTHDQFISDPKFSFNYSLKSLQTEQYILHLLRQKKPSEALQFLIHILTSEVEHDIRIWDMGVQLCFAHDKSGKTSEFLLRRIENRYQDPGRDEADGFIFRDDYATKLLKQRMRKWRNENWVSSMKAKKYFMWNNERF